MRVRGKANAVRQYRDDIHAYSARQRWRRTMLAQIWHGREISIARHDICAPAARDAFSAEWRARWVTVVLVGAAHLQKSSAAIECSKRV